jgi:hypothetical protein
MNEKIRNIILKIQQGTIEPEQDPFEIEIENNPDISLDELHLRVCGISNFQKLRNYFSLPALLIHELLHVIFSILLFKRVVGFNISSPNRKNFGATISYAKFDNSLIRLIIVGFSPALALLSAIVLSFINPWFIIFLVYLLLNLKISMPSKIDYANVFLFKYRNEFENDDDYSSFLYYCCEEMDYEEIILNSKENSNENCN